MHISFGSLIFAVILAEVAPWTIDLPEARKFLFEKNDRIEEKRKDTKYEKEKQNFFSNRYDSNSKHHEEHHEEPHEDYDYHDPYAKDYGYQSYTENKVRGIVYEGSEYLEGLQRSIEHFTQLLENCTRRNETNQRSNVTANQPWRPITEVEYNASSFNASSFNASSFNASSFNASSLTQRCRNVTRASEHVRRLADLSIKATKELQDIAYSRKHMKDDPYELSKQENEQILKLAWFLDRLAYYTDFKPHPKRYISDGYPISTTTIPPVVSLLNASEDTTRRMMNCLKQQSDVPATVRCAYPQDLPPAVQMMINNTNSMPGGQPSSSNRNEKVLPATSEQELLIASDYNTMHLPYHHLSSVTHVKRSAPLSMSFGTVRQKRAITPDSKKEHPAITFMKYFVKHKVWEGANPINEKHFQQFEVNNEINRTKRDTGKRLRIPEDPYQDLSKYVKSKKGVNFVKDEAQAQKIRAFVEKLINTKPKTAKEQLLRISKLFRSKRYSETNSEKEKFRSKRAMTYETDVDKPRESEDLFKDISYFVKNKPGTNFNADFIQAAQVRAGLLQIFANPNIETVRRYGSNFNPLVPDVFISAGIKAAADNY